MTFRRQKQIHVFFHILLLCLLLVSCQIAGAGVRPKRASLDKWRRHAIADLPDRAMFIQAADVDGDGHRDLIAGGWWWKNP
ncbi:MAG: hypothetical protein ACYSWQ_30425, partial [Planctomycetota bacterium]